jgi:hypothetical protein
MSESEKLAGVQGARRTFDDVLPAMERFILNLDLGRGPALPDWLRSVDADGRPDAISGPALEQRPGACFPPGVRVSAARAPDASPRGVKVQGLFAALRPVYSLSTYLSGSPG